MNETHPEYRCQRCGGRNPVWNVDSDRYNTAVNRSEIVCPTCFVLAHEAATGMRTVWQLEPMVPFRWIEDEGRPTPFIRTPKGYLETDARLCRHDATELKRLWDERVCDLCGRASPHCHRDTLDGEETVPLDTEREEGAEPGVRGGES